MKKSLKISTLLTLCLFLTGMLQAQVKSDYDKTIDFTKYKTYSFAGWQNDSDKLINDLDKTRILDAFKAEFDARNMTLVEDNADAVVTLFLVIDNKTSTTAYTNYMGGMGMGYGYGWGMGMGAGMGTSTTTYSENDYEVGTLVVDVYDAGTKKLAWQGVLQKTINEKASKREKTIPKNAAKIMKQYPVPAAKK